MQYETYIEYRQQKNPALFKSRVQAVKKVIDYFKLIIRNIIYIKK